MSLFYFLLRKKKECYKNVKIEIVLVKKDELMFTEWKQKTSPPKKRNLEAFASCDVPSALFKVHKGWGDHWLSLDWHNADYNYYQSGNSYFILNSHSGFLGQI